MGQRGQRKSRRRCQYVDVRTGLRCQAQVKKPGSQYCSREHYARARIKPRVVEPGTRKWTEMAKKKDRDRLTEQFRLIADEQGKIPLLAAVPIAMAAVAIGYQRGYSSAQMKGRDKVHHLRLTASKFAVEEFLSSKFGKGFIMGDLKAADLEKFSFGSTP